MSRLYLVEHYLSDVLNGYLVGALWALVGIWLAELLHSRSKSADHVSFQLWQKVARNLVIAGAAIVVWFVVQDYQQTRNVQTVPAVIQLDASVQAAFATGQMPTHSESILGTLQEPISLIVLAQNERAFLKVFREAGWQLADKPGFGTMSRAAFAIWFNREYETAPVTPAFWNGQPHNFGFQAETTDKSLRQRHHARFWQTGFRTTDGLLIFVGTASFDEGLKWGLTHRIDPNIDAERDLLAIDLQNTGLVNSTSSIQLVEPVLGQNLTGDPFFTDGKAAIMQAVPDTETKGIKRESYTPQ